ncbi:MAG: sigma-70 family RNA polymerase sigma factor [Anaerolineales bacterium]|nr:sigma-70 family RNA polymerase sigma factor [Anaerolineales bacterium]MCX7608989.1 sigma-70 family RNA polymerase sigma factor [Anaerolineales bacterium]MDW8227055.1 sigma-70 family RNA polymerase sigma factor [Anaerolineales bacterium]
MTQLQVEEIESTIIEQSQNGDRHAFGELVRRYYSGVVHVVYRLCGDAALAEDMAQETFLRAWIHLPSYHPQSPFRNWLYRIAVNATFDVLRKQKATELEEEEWQQIRDSSLSPEAIVLAREKAGRIQQAIVSLPEAARNVLVLREYGGLSYQEIAAVLDIPLGTVMSRLNYARNRLREMLQEEVKQQEPEYA